LIESNRQNGKVLRTICAVATVIAKKSYVPMACHLDTQGSQKAGGKVFSSVDGNELIALSLHEEVSRLLAQAAAANGIPAQESLVLMPLNTFQTIRSALLYSRSETAVEAAAALEASQQPQPSQLQIAHEDLTQYVGTDDEVGEHAYVPLSKRDETAHLRSQLGKLQQAIVNQNGVFNEEGMQLLRALVEEELDIIRQERGACVSTTFRYSSRVQISQSAQQIRTRASEKWCTTCKRTTETFTAQLTASFVPLKIKLCRHCNR
jgi:hypothetical protein